MDHTRLSKEIAFALRHDPWQYELELDDEGFVPVGQLLDAINGEGKYDRRITEDDIRHIMDISDKQRFELRDGMIRAYYGHTVPGRIRKEAAKPPPILYHGTSHKAIPLIKEQGLLPMQRQYVHLSADTEMAQRVGRRRDPSPVILTIDTRAAAARGVVFYIGNDRVWLCERIAPELISGFPE